MARKRKKKKSFLLLIVPILICIALLVNIFHFLKSGTATVKIPEGTTSYGISQILKDEGVIESKLYFMVRLYLSPYKSKLQYGTFELEKNSSVSHIFEIMSTKGAKKETISISVPEGFSVENIKDRVVKAGLCSEKEFEDALKKDYNYSFLKAIPSNSDAKYKLQGFLYPSTYEFYKTDNAEAVINKLLSEFDKQVGALHISNSKLYDILIKASMLEREALLDSEKEIIAGVFENRLKADMRLQIDATVAYVITDGKYDVNKITYKNLKVDSKYNTYQNKGLPPGPICNPSLSSIKAAMHPKSHKYLYYHTDNDKKDGSHIFTETFEEHKTTK